eukprot:364570-Chlamydomonas_euryale.AAC.20
MKSDAAAEVKLLPQTDARPLVPVIPMLPSFSRQAKSCQRSSGAFLLDDSNSVQPLGNAAHSRVCDST